MQSKCSETEIQFTFREIHDRHDMGKYITLSHGDKNVLCKDKGSASGLNCAYVKVGQSDQRRHSEVASLTKKRALSGSNSC